MRLLWTGMVLLAVVVATLPARAEDLKAVSQADYLGELARLQGVVRACQARATDCDPARVGKDVQVGAAASQESFAVRWDWLRTALEKGRDAKAEDRTEQLAEAQARLDGEAAEVGAAPSLPTPMTEARAKADAILRRREFGRVQDQSYWARKMAQLGLLLDAAFMAAGSLLPKSSWVGLALEWGFLALAAAGLVVWALRVSRQQRVVLAAGPDAGLGGWEKESEDWAARAQASAAAGEWREAVHSLYWAAIVMLEGQKMWRANRARTPREYVRLLEPGSPKRRALGGLTGVFERLWYGLRPAAETDYRQAEALLAELRTDTARTGTAS